MPRFAYHTKVLFLASLLTSRFHYAGTMIANPGRLMAAKDGWNKYDDDE